MEKSLVFQEKHFNKNRWQFSKAACSGSLGTQTTEPTFLKPAADEFYRNTYSVPKNIDLNKLDWFPKIETQPSQENFVQFDLSPVKPKEVFLTLRNAKQNSASYSLWNTYETKEYSSHTSYRVHIWFFP